MSGVSLVFTNPNGFVYRTTALSIMFYDFTDVTYGSGLNGKAVGATQSHPAMGLMNGGHVFGNTSGNADLGNDNAGFVGNMGELIVYGSGAVTGVERNKIDAYLAIKYGVILDTSRNYINAAGDTVWNKVVNKIHYHNVAGLARENISDLYQKQARSQEVNTNDQVRITLGAEQTTNQLNTNTLVNSDFMLWGDNGKVQAMSNVASTYETFTYNGNSDNRRMTRVWEVRNRGVGEAVRLAFPTASVGTTTLTNDGSCSKYVIIYAADSDFTTNVVAAPLITDATLYRTGDRSFPQGTSYFTFAKVKETAPGYVIVPDTSLPVPFTDICKTGVWKYYYFDAAKTQKAFAINFNGNTEPTISGNITYNAPHYTQTDGTFTSKIMGRLTEILPAGGSYTVNGGLQVRIYFDSTELLSSLVPSPTATTWFKHPGDAAAVLAAQTSSTITGATFLTPASSGEEDAQDYVQFNGIQSFSTFSFVSTNASAPLPISLLRFSAVASNNTALINWVVDNKQPLQNFEVQHSANGQIWKTLGLVNPDANPVTATSEYSFTDRTPVEGANLYRLKLMNFNGSAEYSEIRRLIFGKLAPAVSVYPNPANDVVTITGLAGTGYTLKLTNTTGQTVRTMTVAVGQETVQIKLDGLADGVYNINLTNAQGSTSSYRVVKGK